MNNCKTSLPTNISGVSVSEEITQMRQKHYYELFNSFKSNSFVVGSIDNDEVVNVSP